MLRGPDCSPSSHSTPGEPPGCCWPATGPPRPACPCQALHFRHGQAGAEPWYAEHPPWDADRDSQCPKWHHLGDTAWFPSRPSNYGEHPQRPVWASGPDVLPAELGQRPAGWEGEGKPISVPKGATRMPGVVGREEARKGEHGVHALTLPLPLFPDQTAAGCPWKAGCDCSWVRRGWHQGDPPTAGVRGWGEDFVSYGAAGKPGGMECGNPGASDLGSKAHLPSGLVEVQPALCPHLVG